MSIVNKPGVGQMAESQQTVRGHLDPFDVDRIEFFLRTKLFHTL